MGDATVSDFLTLSVPKLENFIHARKFDGSTFQKSKLCGADGKLNKTRYAKQSAESIQNDCTTEEPCLVWIAWKLRSSPLVLKERPEPVMDLSFHTPEFTVIYATPALAKLPSQYLRDTSWVKRLQSVVKGVSFLNITEDLMKNADSLALTLQPRLQLHIAERVKPALQNHWTLGFTRDNIPLMAAAMSLAGHVADDLDTYNIAECLLSPPSDSMFQLISNNLGGCEGCYLYYNTKKHKWVRSGKTAGEGDDACFRGRGNKHKKNSALIEEMRKLSFYKCYPTKSVQNLGAVRGYFDDLAMYCGLGFDAKADLSSLLSSSMSTGVFIWSTEVMEELNKKGGNLQRLQLNALSYLWEICYDLVLAKCDNVSDSPGFESFGLRVFNDRKRKRGE